MQKMYNKTQVQAKKQKISFFVLVACVLVCPTSSTSPFLAKLSFAQAPYTEEIKVTEQASQGTGGPINMTVTTTINNPQTQNAPVTTTTPIHLQGTSPQYASAQQAPLAPLLQGQPLPSPQAQINSSFASAFASPCAPSFERNLTLDATWNMLVPRRQVYSNDPALTSKAEPRVYTRRPLVRNIPTEELYSYSPIGRTNQKTSNPELNAQVHARNGQASRYNSNGGTTRVYPVINRGDGVRALQPRHVASNSASSSQNRSAASPSSHNNQDPVTAQKDTPSTAATSALNELKEATPQGSTSQDTNSFKDVSTPIKVSSGSEIVINPGEYVTVWAEEAEKK